MNALFFSTLEVNVPLEPIICEFPPGDIGTIKPTFDYYFFSNGL